MKTTLKKTMAALSAAAVVAASAAVMAVPTSAATSAVVTWSSVTMTLEELEAANYQVTLTADCNTSWTKLAFGAQMGTGLEYVSAKAMAGGAKAEKDGQLWLAGASADGADAGSCGSVTVSVTTDAKAGDVFTVEGLAVSATGNSAEWADKVNGEEGSTPTVISGTITIKEEEVETTTTTTTTEAVADEEETTTTTTAAAVSVATTTASSTSSPKTGDALPVAGVAAAVAVIGGVALVSKKRK